MAFKTKRLLKKIVSWSGLFFFAVAAYMIYHQLSKYKLEDIKDALVSIPAHNLFLACMASLGGYVALSSYDFLALKYIGRKLAPWKWIFAGFIGFSISNNAGHAIVSGGAIRYRLYTRWAFPRFRNRPHGHFFRFYLSGRLFLSDYSRLFSDPGSRFRRRFGFAPDHSDRNGHFRTRSAGLLRRIAVLQKADNHQRRRV